MISYNFSRTIGSIYDQVRFQNPAQSREGHHYYNSAFLKDPGVALYLKLDVSADNGGYEIDGNTHHPEWVRSFYKEMHFLIASSHKVFLAITSGKFTKLSDIPVTAWKNLSNHDSCWHTTGVQQPITQMMFDAWDHCFSHMPEEHLREKLKSSGVDMEFDNSGGIIKFARITHEALDITDHYFRKITSVKPLIATIGFKEE